jgi:hypothetical protein
MKQTINHLYFLFLSKKVREKGERWVLSIAIASYLIHLFFIFLVHIGFLDLSSNFFANPIFAIYTPFSFILIYEVYLLIFYLPKSITIYIGKQYEIITLIVIRRIFKDIANLDLQSNWFSNRYDLQFTYDALSALILFVLIYYFYKYSPTKKSNKPTDITQLDRSIQYFVLLKRSIALCLLPILICLGILTLGNWSYDFIYSIQTFDALFKNINAVFFDDFFSLLIVVDVLLLLASFYHSDQFHKIIRNSGFVISTILIKLSFSNEGLLNNFLIIGAVVFGLSMLKVHNLYAQKLPVERE